MADDNAKETKAEIALVQQAPPTDAFRKCMIGVKLQCHELAAAIERHDFEAVESIADSAVNMWLAGRAALRLLLERATQSSPYTEAARELLKEHYTKLLLLFTHAIATIAVPRMANALRHLRTRLTSAMSQPLSAS